MKKVSFILLFFLCAGKSFAQKAITEKKEKKTEADYYWETMPSNSYYEILEGGIKNFKPLFMGWKGVDAAGDISTLNDETWKKAAEMSEWQRTFYELQARYFREWGVVFWERFPDDDRRFDWLEQTMAIYPSYAKNYQGIYMNENSISDSLLFDKTAFERWNRFFQRYRQEVLASVRLTAARKLSFEKLELEGMIAQWRNFYVGKKFGYINWLERAVKYAKALNGLDELSERSLINNFNYTVLEDLEGFGLTGKDADIIVSKLENSGIRSFEKVAIGYQKPMRHLLEKTPLRFNEQSTDGKSVELSEYKGKLVLVDFWNLGCGACIAAMPKWRKIYEKYNKYGFELISACFVAGNYDGKPVYKDEIASVKTVHQKFSPGWPLVLLYKDPGKNKHRFYDQYDIVGNPVYMLFDENGKPLITNGALMRNPESVIRNYLIKTGKIK